MTPNALAEQFGTTRQAVSKHIRILTECQLLKQEKVGREIYYHFNPTKMMEIEQWMEQALCKANMYHEWPRAVHM